MYRLFFSLALVLVLGKLAAQNQIKSDSTKKQDSTSKIVKIKPKIRVGLDVSRLFLSATRSGYRAGEASLDFNIGRLIYGVHAGFAQRTFSLTNEDAFASGVYASAGVCRNVFEESDNILAFGGRLAGNFYKNQARNVGLLNPFTGEKSFQDLEEGNARMLWLEFVSTMRAKVWGWMMMGFELRVKYRLSNKYDAGQPYFSPGFGLTENKMNLGFNYFIFINLPTKK
jgi:hypothetical protein